MAKKKQETVVNEEVCEDVPMGAVDDPGRLLPTSLKFDWSPEERETIETVKSIVKQEVSKDFGQVAHVLHDMLRKVRMQEVDANGKPLYDETGAPVWQKWPDGSIKEDWSRIDAADIDAFLMNAAVFSFFVAQSVVDAYGEAVFAKYMSEDKFAEVYDSLIEGTIDDKRAAASKKSRLERYFAFYKAYKYRYMREMMDRIDSISRRLETVRKYQIEDAKRTAQVSTNRPNRQ